VVKININNNNPKSGFLLDRVKKIKKCLNYGGKKSRFAKAIGAKKIPTNSGEKK
jgi:hypothetical protein